MTQSSQNNNEKGKSLPGERTNVRSPGRQKSRTPAPPGRSGREQRPAGQTAEAAATAATPKRQPFHRSVLPRNPVLIRGGIIYPRPSRKILDPLMKARPQGESIRAFRKAINLNIKDFAFFIGVDPATVFRWETQRTGRLHTASISKVLKLVNSVAAGKPIKIPFVKVITGPGF
ncbi:MAG: helix-turn-helix domain-containing protein [Deltaproteobacteria bacterium]|nr:helix-turn-helix domain-containing protein [Deltaproteobacteria bacterium]